MVRDASGVEFFGPRAVADNRLRRARDQRDAELAPGLDLLLGLLARADLRRGVAPAASKSGQGIERGPCPFRVLSRYDQQAYNLNVHHGARPGCPDYSLMQGYFRALFHR